MDNPTLSEQLRDAAAMVLVMLVMAPVLFQIGDWWAL